MNDDFNMSMRKFLKQVGVTSQKAIEDALRDANNGEYIVEAKITIKDIGMEHTVSGTIKNGDQKVALTRESVIEALKTIQGPKGQDIVTGGEVRALDVGEKDVRFVLEIDQALADEYSKIKDASEVALKKTTGPAKFLQC